MGRRKIQNNNIRSLTKVSRGESYSVTIPIAMIRKLRWKGRQKLVVKLRGKTITIKDWPVKKKKYS